MFHGGPWSATGRRAAAEPSSSHTPPAAWASVFFDFTTFVSFSLYEAGPEDSDL